VSYYDKDLTIHEVAYHRNGICGTGFHVIRFADNDEQREFVGVVFGYNPVCYRDDETGEFDDPVYMDPHVAVLDADLVIESVEFGVNSWRGDTYAEKLYKAIDTYSEERRAAWAQT